MKNLKINKMNKIEKAASDYLENEYLEINYTEDNYAAGVYDGFIAGARFVQKWIDVRDELPEKDKTVLVKYDDSAGRYKPKIKLGKYAGDKSVDEMYCRYDTPTKGVTHWREIELT